MILYLIVLYTGRSAVQDPCESPNLKMAVAPEPQAFIRFCKHSINIYLGEEEEKKIKPRLDIVQSAVPGASTLICITDVLALHSVTTHRMTNNVFVAD